MEKLKYIKIEHQDGTLSENVPIGADAENVEVANQENLSQRLVRIDEDLEKNEAKADQAILDSATAQNTANTANTNAQNAQTTANSASTSASNANTSASNANTKIDNAKIVGEYTSGTETLEISLELGKIQQKGE